VRNARTTERVARHFEINRNTSTRRASLTLGIARTTMERSLHELSMYPYHFTPVQNLFSADYQRRERFCQWYLHLDVNTSSKILWTDQSTFTRTGVFNYHNSHYWCEMNPHLSRISSFQHIRYDSWLQLDGCPAHSARIVRDWLNQSYPEKWIGRWGPVG
ncbi:hypothetical protein X777_15035, partial [Ooceraea biroi]